MSLLSLKPVQFILLVEVSEKNILINQIFFCIFKVLFTPTKNI